MVLARVAFARVLSSTRSGSATVRWVGYTSMRKFGYFFSSARAPAVNWPSYWAMFLAVMVRRGFSFANGSMRTELPALKPGGGVVRPPV